MKFLLGLTQVGAAALDE